MHSDGTSEETNGTDRVSIAGAAIAGARRDGAGDVVDVAGAARSARVLGRRGVGAEVLLAIEVRASIHFL